MKANIMFLAVSAACAEMACAQSLPVNTLPTGGVVRAGAAQIGAPSVTGGGVHQLTITQSSQRAVLDWASLNVGSNAALVHDQALGAASITAHRVPGAIAPSVIEGMLSAPGNVMILNSRGVMFGPSASVNVAGLIASTGDLNPAGGFAEFMAGGAFAIAGATAGAITNQGSITVSDAGLAAFVAPSVTNAGSIVAASGRIVLAAAQTATVSFNGGLYELAVNQGVAGGAIANSGTLSAPGGSIALSALDAANVVSGVINLEGVQQASRIEVHGGHVTLSSDLDAATVTGSSRVIDVCDCGQIQDAVDIALSGAPGAGASIHVSGTHDAPVVIDKDHLTLTGNGGATLNVAAGQTGFTIAADGVTVQDMKAVGPYGTHYTAVNWNAEPGITSGFTLQSGVSGTTLRDNEIRNLRSGVLMLGAAPDTAITGNLIDNTKGSMLVRSNGATISGNLRGASGSEWDIVFLNGVSDGAYFTSPHASQQEYGAGMMAMSADNGGMRILDRRYGSNGLLGSTPQFGNRSHIVVSAGSSFTAADDFNLGNGLGNERQPLGSIGAGVNAVVHGGFVDVGAGTYAESVTLAKALTLSGAGKGVTVIDPPGGNGDGILVQGNIGAGASVSISDLTIQGGRNGVRVADGTTLGTITLEDVVIRDNASNGFISNNGGSNPTSVATINILDSLFQGNGVGNGSADINLFRFNGTALLSNLDILGTRSTDTASATDYGLQIRGHGELASMTAAGQVTLDNVRIAGTYRKAHLAIQRYSDATGVVMNDVTLGSAASQAGWGAFFSSDMAGSLSLAGASFAGGSFGFGDIALGGGTAGLRVDASQTAFSGIARSHTAAGAENFALEDRVMHALDAAGIGGLVTWQADNVYVTQSSGSIQRGIDAAGAGDSVRVGAGLYAEQLNITKDLALLGAGSGLTTVRPGTLADAGGMRSILTIGGGAEAEVSGFTFRGPVPEINAGIFVRDGAHAHLHHNAIVDIRESVALSGNQRGIGIYVGRAVLGTSGSALIEDNVITGYQKGGIVVDGPGSQATISGNAVTGEGPTGATAQNGIQASRGASAQIFGNAITGNHYTGADEAAGILIFTPGFYLGQGSIVVGPNTVSGNEVGVWTNDPGTLQTISLSGVSGNVRNGVAGFSGGFAGAGQFLEYPAWSSSSSVLVNGGAFSGAQSGDMLALEGALRVSGWDGFAAIQPAIDAVAAGGTVSVASGSYVQDATLNVNKALTLAGAGQGETIIDARGVAGYGMLVNADEVSLSHFTLWGPQANAGTSYGIKVQPAGSGADARLHDFSISHVTSRGAGRAELDLNGVVGATIDHFTAQGDNTAGAGIQLTDSANVTISNSTTESNAWGGVAIFQANRFFDQQVSDISVLENNHFGEANPLYLQDESASRNFGTLSLQGFDHAVRNTSNDQFTWLQYELGNALGFAVALDTPSSSYVQGWDGSAATQIFHVGSGMSIATAVAQGTSGATVNVGAGTYAENVVVDQARRFAFDDVTLQSLTVNAAGTGIGGRATANGAGGFVFNAPVVLHADTSLRTTGADIAFNADIQNAGSKAFDLRLSAGTGDVTLVSGGSSANPLGRFAVTADEFNLAGTLWVSGYDIDALGDVALSSSTLRSRGGSGNSITAGGSITGSTVTDAPLEIESGGEVAMKIVSTSEVAIQAADGVEITGSALSVAIDAPQGSVTGAFGEIANVGGGVLEVNGRQEIPQALSTSFDPSRVLPADGVLADGSAVLVGADARGAAGEDERRDSRVVRRAARDAGAALDSGVSVEIDLRPGNAR